MSIWHLAGVCYILAGVGFACGMYMDCGGRQSIINCIFEYSEDLDLWVFLEIRERSLLSQ